MIESGCWSDVRRFGVTFADVSQTGPTSKRRASPPRTATEAYARPTASGRRPPAAAAAEDTQARGVAAVGSGYPQESGMNTGSHQCPADGA